MAVSSAKASSAEPQEIHWPEIAWIGALLILCYAPVLASLVHDWMVDENVSHGFFVPAVAAYVVWQKREQLRAARISRNWWGLVVVVVAAAQLYVGTLGVELFLSRTAFVFSVIGAVWFLGGTQILRILAFPLFLLFFMIPIPAILYNQITLPLQFLASDLAAKTLSLLGVPVLRQGNILELATERLSVVDACSGIRSLLSLSFLSLVYGYFFERKTWIRVFLFFATIPVAIAANGGRVTLTGLLSEVNPRLAKGAFHLVEGWIVFLVALFLLIAIHQLLLLVVNKMPGGGKAARSQPDPR